MDTKWKKWKGAISFAAFFLTVNLLAAGIFLMAMVPLGGITVSDAVETDYQNTQAFRELVATDLNALVALAGGSTQVVLPLRDGNSQMDAKLALDVLAADKNLLYEVIVEGWSPSNGNPGANYAGMPSGYNFYLNYPGGEADIWKDGQKLDVYGDGYYYGGDQWAIPGYSNREGADGVKISMAVAQNPVEYVGPLGGSPLYSLAQNLALARTRLLIGASLAGAGLLLLALSIAWRKERAGARKAVAARTGKIWFDVKLLALVPVAYVALVVGTGFWRVIRDMTYAVYRFAHNDGNDLEVAVMACVLFYTGWLLYFMVNDLRYNRAPWRASLTAKLCRRVSKSAVESAPKASALNIKLASWTGKVWIEIKVLILLLSPKVLFSATAANLIHRFFNMLDLWWVASLFVMLRLPILLAVLYLFINDLRLNRGQFERGLTAYFQNVLRASEEKYSIRARLTRRAWFGFFCALPFVVTGCLFCVIWIATAWNSSERYRILMVPVPFLALALFALLLWYFRRALATARDVGALAEQITAIRAGDLTRELTLPKDADLRGLSAALGDIQSGMRAAMEEQLRSERMRVELIANVSHDLKTPLTSVVSYAELLRQEEGLPDHVKDYITILNDKAERLKSMVQDVFEVSKAASGELNLHVERLDLGKLLRQTLADMADPIAQSGLVFRTDLPADAVFINADGSRLYRVFQNLIQNALQYSLDGSRVHITLKTEEDLARAEVKNTSRAELPADTDLTARFVRGDASRTGEGSGLGLAIASSFTASCGGSFRVETNADLFCVKAEFPLAR